MNSSSLNLTSDNNIFSNFFSYYSRGQLSWVLVPISFFIIYHKKYIKYFSYAFITIAIIGTIDTYLIYKYEFNNSNNIILIILGLIILLHLILLYPLTNIKKYMEPNIIQYISCIFGILTSYLLPYWPYLLSRTTVIITTFITYATSTLLYFIII